MNGFGNWLRNIGYKLRTGFSHFMAGRYGTDKLNMAILCTGLAFSLLASFFRLVGYSINFFINSFILLIVGSILKDSLDIAFWMYALALLLFPRIMWISDRFATTTDYDHSEYSFWSNITTDFYTVKDVDWWENDADSWRLLPLQIIFSLIFYLIGSLTLLAVCPIESGWLQGLYLVLATAVNILFDIFVTRNIEEAID